MKEINLKLGLKELIGIILIVVFISFGVSEIENTIKFKFGSVVLVDTLTGSLKVSSGGIYTDDSIYTTGGGHFGLMTGFPSGIMFASSTQYIDDDGVDLTYCVSGSGIHTFYNNGTTISATIDTVDGIEATRHFTISEVATKPAEPTADIESRIYMKGNNLIVWFLDGATNRFFYVALDSAGEQGWRYSTKEPY